MSRFAHRKKSEHQRLYFVFTLLVVLFSGSIFGYMFLEHYSFLEALYMTVITVTTVGFREVKPLNSAGLVFTIGVILAGFMVLAVSAQTIMSVMLEKVVSRTMGHHKMEKEIETLKGHYIVCGLGRVGEAAVERLSKEEIDFVVIEVEEEAADKFRQEGIFTLIGNCTDEDVLIKAGIKRARGLLVLTSTETENLYITLTARELNPTLQIIARGENKSSERKLKRAGADEVISPYTFAGVQIAEKVLLATDGRAAVSIEAGQSPEWITVPKGSEWIGEPLHLIAAREGWRVLGIRRGGKDVLFPEKKWKIKKGDRLLLISHQNVENKSTRSTTVLIVEDNRITASLYMRILRRENFRVKSVLNGVEALEVISAEKPDVAVIDNMLPGMSGIEVCKAVRAREELNSVRLILFTGDEHPETKRRALESGADAFLLKTSEASELVRKIRLVLEESPKSVFPGSGKPNEIEMPGEEIPRELASQPDVLSTGEEKSSENELKMNVPIDFAEAFDRCGNDWDFFSEMFTEFVNYLPEQIRKIKDAYVARDWEMLHSEGHRCKGAAANFGATVLTDLARQIEEAGRNRKDLGVDDLIHRMEARVEVLQSFQKNMTPALATNQLS